jgi:hypothetical protein
VGRNLGSNLGDQHEIKTLNAGFENLSRRFLLSPFHGTATSLQPVTRIMTVHSSVNSVFIQFK